MNTKLTKQTIYPKGAPIAVDAIQTDGKVYIIQGKFLKIASLKDEWQQDVDDPDETIAVLKRCPIRVDMLRFWQRIPESEPKFRYYREWRHVAAIPIANYKQWWDKQIRFRARNKMRKAQKLGVVVQEAQFDDDFVR